MINIMFHLPVRAAFYPIHDSHILQERNAAIIRAEGESEAAKLISDATKKYGGGLIELRRIEAAKDIADTMGKSRNVVYLPSGGNMLLGLNNT
jgi:prohibitin 1